MPTMKEAQRISARAVNSLAQLKDELNAALVVEFESEGPTTAADRWYRSGIKDGLIRAIAMLESRTDSEVRDEAMHRLRFGREPTLPVAVVEAGDTRYAERTPVKRQPKPATVNDDMVGVAHPRRTRGTINR